MHVHASCVQLNKDGRRLEDEGNAIHLVVLDARKPSPVGMAPALVPGECHHLEHHTETHHHNDAAQGLMMI